MNRRMIVTAAAGLLLGPSVGIGLWAQSGQAGKDKDTVRLPIRVVQGTDVISGENFGFQPASKTPNANGRIVGKLMVRLDGKWLEVELAAQKGKE
jgi:hypothetical protein